MKGDRLGEFEELVLLAVRSLGAEAYTVSIQARLRESAGRPAALGAIYAALDRMERKRWVRSRVGGATAVRGGRRKRFFSISPSGISALTELAAARQRLIAASASASISAPLPPGVLA